MLGGDWSRGFKEYEWRHRQQYAAPRVFAQPEWDGTPLMGRRLLIWAEQGFGDAIQFIRYFADTAAILMQLDLIITVDTAVAHLAGALGRLTWVLLPFLPDWCWLLDRNDSPWYPTMRLFRQSQPGDWQRVMARVQLSLQALRQA